MIKRALFTAVAIILVVAAALLILYRKAVYLTFCNLTAPSLELPETGDWEGGSAQKGIQYAGLSENEYLDLYIPKGVEAPPLLVLIHGGGFLYGDTDTRQCVFMYSYFRDHGYAVASVQYRMAQEASYPAAVEDVKAAIRYLRAHAGDYGYDASRVAVWGESAGGYLAAMAALTTDDEFNDLPFIDQDSYGAVSSEVDCLIDYYGVCDFTNNKSDLKEDGVPDFVYNIANSWATSALGEYDTIEEIFLGRHLYDMTEEEKEQLSPAYYAKKNLPSLSLKGIWLAHGTADITVSSRQSMRLRDACEGKGCKLTFKSFPRCRHADDRFYSEQSLGEVDEFLKEIFAGELMAVPASDKFVSYNLNYQRSDNEKD